MARARPVVAGLAGLLVALSGCGGDSGRPVGRDAARPSARALSATQARIEADRRALAAEGVFVVNVGRRAECVAVTLANPTAPNRAYVTRRYGPSACVDRAPDGPVQACAGAISRRVPHGPVTVPELRGLGVHEAERRVVRAGLTYAITCLTERQRTARRPPADSPAALALITAQCPRPGERVPRGAQVALQGVARLPGAFDYPVGALDRYNTETAHPCRDGRNP